MASADAIRAKLEASDLRPTLVAATDVTGGGQCGAKFDVVVVSAAFDGVGLLDRHRRVQAAIADEMQLLHALTIKALTPAQYDAKRAKGEL